MLGRAIQWVKKGRAERARTVFALKLRGLAVSGRRTRVLGVAREHEVVDRQRVLVRGEELRELQFCRLSIRIEPSKT